MTDNRLRPPLITLTTDFGLTDTYVGVMKGVIYGIAPDARIIDLTHDIAPQNILEASARLQSAIDYFPVGTVHVVVVDPGVGSTRRACVTQTERALFVAPDNGVLTQALQRQPPVRAVHLTDKARPYCLPAVSATFHGRDLFAPIAAHLANGLPLEALGKGIDAADLVALPLSTPQAEQDAEGQTRLALRVLYADRFGNLITDLERDVCKKWLRQSGIADMERAGDQVVVQAGNQTWRGLCRTFAEAAPGEPLAYCGSSERLEIAVRDGNAAQALGLAPGDTLTLTFAF